MKLYNCYVGLDKYDSSKGVVSYTQRIAPSLKTQEVLKKDLQHQLLEGKILWYLIDIANFNPKTGKIEHTCEFDSVPPKERIILNPQAQKGHHLLDYPEEDFPPPINTDAFFSKVSTKTPKKAMPATTIGTPQGWFTTTSQEQEEEI